MKWALSLVLLLGTGLGFAWWKSGVTAEANAPAAEVPTTRVRRGDVSFSIVAKGELQGGNSQMLTVPMTGGQPVAITQLRQNGELIKAGDIIVRFDTTEQEFKLREAQSDIAEAQQQVVQAKSEADAKEEEARYLIIQARADLKVAGLEARKNPLLASITARQNELAVAQARDRLEQLEKDLPNRLATARAGIAIHDASVQKAQVKAVTAQQNIDKMTLRAKSAGYVALQPNQEGNMRWGMYMPPYQIGDISRPGMAVAQIPDLGHWEASAKISELDRGHLAEGQPAQLTVVALPGRTLAGQVKTMGGTTGSPWDRHFDCRVGLAAPAPELRPGMSAVITINTGVEQGVLWVPAQAVFESDGRRFVHARRAGRFTPVDITLVRRSETQVVITGLPEGEEIAMADPNQGGEKKGGGGALQALPKKS